jgi:hypothetical protein
MVPSGRLSLGSAGTIEGPRDLIIGTVRTDSLAGAETCSIERIPTSYFHKAHDTQIINCVGASPNARPPRALTLLLRSGLRHSSRTKSMSVGSIQSSVGCRKGVLGPSLYAPPPASWPACHCQGRERHLGGSTPLYSPPAIPLTRSTIRRRSSDSLMRMNDLVSASPSRVARNSDT